MESPRAERARLVKAVGFINTRYHRETGIGRWEEQKRETVALLPYSWIGLLWKVFPFNAILLFSFSETKPPSLPLPPARFSQLFSPHFPKLPFTPQSIYLLVLFTFSLFRSRRMLFSCQLFVLDY